MTNLSPAAQEVFDAALFEVNAECDARWIAAAALRAAINQVVPPDPCGHDCCITVCEQIRSDFLAIVNELEGTN
jgi:hypothetical protein